MRPKTFYFNLLLIFLLIGVVSTQYTQNSIAQHYTQMSLPKGAKARLGKGKIKDLLYSPDGNVLAVVSSIGIWLYDTKTYQEFSLLPIPLHVGNPMAYKIIYTTFSVDGQKIFGETEEKLMIMWNIATGECIIRSLIGGVSYIDDKQKLTIEGENKSIELWSGKKEIIEKKMKKEGEIDIIIAYSPDGKTSAILEDKYTVRINNIRDQKLSESHIKFPKFKYGQRIHLSPDAKTLAIMNVHSPILLWDVYTDKLNKTLPGHLVRYSSTPINTRYNTTGPVDSIAFSPDGKTLANGTMDGTIRLWNVNNGELKNTIQEQIGFVRSLAFSPDGKLLASGCDDGSIFVWDTTTGTHEPFLAERMNSITCVAFSNDGKMLGGGDPNGDIYLFDVNTSKHIKTFLGHIEEINLLHFSPDDTHLASLGWDGSIRLWDIETGKLVKTFSIPISYHSEFWRDIFFTKDGNLLAINSEFDFIHIWNVNTGDYKQMLTGHTSHLTSFSVSSDKQTLASFSADGIMLLWDLTTVTNVTD